MSPIHLVDELEAAHAFDPLLFELIIALVTPSTRHAAFSRDAMRYAVQHFELLTPTVRAAVHVLAFAPGNVQNQYEKYRLIWSVIERQLKGLV